MTSPIFGFLYGGSSSVNCDGFPFRTVFERKYDAQNVASIPSTITVSTAIAETKVLNTPDSPAPIKIAEIVISVGNLPLQGTREIVSMAISRSLGESIILAPVTPAALHPRPIHIVRHCLP